MVNMLNLCWTCSIYDEHAQFMVNMLNLWWTCSFYSEYVQFMMNILNLISELDWPWKNDPLNVKIRSLDPKIQWYLFWSQLICTVTADLTSQLDWPRKTTPKWLFECQNPSTGSKVIVVLYKTQEGYKLTARTAYALITPPRGWVGPSLS